MMKNVKINTLETLKCILDKEKNIYITCEYVLFIFSLTLIRLLMMTLAIIRNQRLIWTLNNFQKGK